MKLFLSIFALALVASSSAFPNPFNIFTLGQCPKATPLPEPFKLNDYLGTWYGIASFNSLFEAGLRCVTANYTLDSTSGNIIIHNGGVNEKNQPSDVTGTGKTTKQDNVWSLKYFSFTPPASYWIVDTDYTEYSLVVSCNNVLGIFNYHDAWIFSRKPTLDTNKIEQLKAKLGSLFPELPAKYFETTQNC